MNRSNKEKINELLKELKFAKEDMKRFRKEIEKLDLKHGIYDTVKESRAWVTETG